MKRGRHDEGFGSYKADAANWITLAGGQFYPDILADAVDLYTPVLVLFGQLVVRSESSQALYLQILEQRPTWIRTQLLRVFVRYVSPGVPAQLLMKKNKAPSTCEHFGARFRPVNEVQAAFKTRPMPDEVMCALLWEYKDRGKKGYDLTERLFGMLRSAFPDLVLEGPPGAGRDIRMGTVFADYPKHDRPVDFVMYDAPRRNVLAIGLARYDSDRGGAQEDDRTGGYSNCADEILSYTRRKGLKTKVVFVNDGPGLLMGSMWDDYDSLERRWPGKILVLTLRMVPRRLSRQWLLNA